MSYRSPPHMVLSVFPICEAAHVPQEVAWTEMTPEISIKANYIFGADSLFWANEVICPSTTTKTPANVF